MEIPVCMAQTYFLVIIGRSEGKLGRCQYPFEVLIPIMLDNPALGLFVLGPAAPLGAPEAIS